MRAYPQGLERRVLLQKSKFLGLCCHECPHARPANTVRSHLPDTRPLTRCVKGSGGYHRTAQCNGVQSAIKYIASGRDTEFGLQGPPRNLRHQRCTSSRKMEMVRTVPERREAPSNATIASQHLDLKEKMEALKRKVDSEKSKEEALMLELGRQTAQTAEEIQDKKSVVKEDRHQAEEKERLGLEREAHEKEAAEEQERQRQAEVEIERLEREAEDKKYEEEFARAWEEAGRESQRLLREIEAEMAAAAEEERQMAEKEAAAEQEGSKLETKLELKQANVEAQTRKLWEDAKRNAARGKENNCLEGSIMANYGQCPLPGGEGDTGAATPYGLSTNGTLPPAAPSMAYEASTSENPANQSSGGYPANQSATSGNAANQPSKSASETLPPAGPAGGTGLGRQEPGVAAPSYACLECGEACASSSRLREHLKMHDRRRRFACNVCGLRFVRHAALVLHRSVHTVEKPYLCHDCGKRFSRKNYLKKHVWAAHIGRKPYECDVCSRRFSRGDLRKKHRMTHTGEKPHQCDLCGRRFTQRSVLVSHRRVHTGEKPYDCDGCDKKFTCPRSLRNHKNSRVGGCTA